jgi:hypothetical protein
VNQVQDNVAVLTALRPTWIEIDPANPPKAFKALFKTDYGQAVPGTWYEGCEWTWVCPMPQHTPEQKKLIRERNASPKGRFIDGKTQEGK